MRKQLVVIMLMCVAASTMLAQNTLPGVVVNHIPASSGQYLGSPSICVLPDGTYVVSHDYFGPKSKERDVAKTDILISDDEGISWKKISTISGQFWSSLFYHEGALYIFGTFKNHGNIVIRKSCDGGHTWTNPYNADNGLLCEGEYHTAPVPIVIHKGRIWRAFEYATAKEAKWPERYSAIVMSAPVHSDLLKAKNWRRSETLYSEKPQLNGNFRGWLEGNIVYDHQNNELLNILRVHAPKQAEEYVAKVHVSPNGKKLKYQLDTGLSQFPGGSKKFTIRYDESTKKYWTISNLTYPDSLGGIQNDRVRNRLALCCSSDLDSWEVKEIIMEHHDCIHHGFQYVDWLFDGEDIIAVIRTAYDDEEGCANNYHDSNYILFKRLIKYNK